LNFTDNGDGTAVISADTIPYIDAFAGNWEFAIRASDGTANIDTTVSLFVTFYTAISQSAHSVFTVYPNPAKNDVSIQLESPVISKTLLRIYNVSGNLICEKEIKEQYTQYNLSELSHGMYLFEIISKGKATSVAKVLVD